MAFGGIWLAWTRSSTMAQWPASSTTDLIVEYGRMSNAAAGFSLAWHPAQYVARNGLTDWLKRRSREVSVGVAACAVVITVIASNNNDVVNETQLDMGLYKAWLMIHRECPEGQCV